MRSSDGGRAASIDFARFAGVGQHPFADYDANGSVESAFRFVLARLTDRKAGEAARHDC